MDAQEKEYIREIASLLERGDLDTLSKILEPLHPADIAEALNFLDDHHKVTLVKRLDKEKAAEVLAEVDEKSGQVLLNLLTNKEVVSILEEMPSDDAADLISSLPPEMSKQIDSLLPSDDREILRGLLEFKEDTAGGIMEVEVLAAGKNDTIADALRMVRERADEIENIQKVFVVDDGGVLSGHIDVLDLLRYEPSKRVSEVMEDNFITVPVNMDQEEVANLFGKYDEFSLPVVDEKGILLGRITVDDIIDVMEEEASEDITRIAGTDEDEIGETSPVRISRSRLPWLIIGMLGGVLNAWLFSRYEESIETLVTMVFFIPLLIGMAGNTGLQAAVVVVRELALKEIDVGHTWRRVWKELQVSMLNGFLLGALLFLVVYLWHHDPGLGLLLWVSLVIVVNVAAFMGAAIPLLLEKLKADPAIATGPFLTVTNDIIGLIIYLSLATLYLSLVS